MKIIRTPLAAAVFLGLMLGAAFMALGQSVFPVRLDTGAAPVPNALGVDDGIAAGTLRLPPLDAPPFACDGDKLGTIYVQRVLSTLNGWDQVVCVCAPVDNNPSAFFWKWIGPTFNNCQDYT